MIINKKNICKDNKILKYIIITSCCVVYFITFAVFSNLIMIFGPAALIVIFSLIYSIKR